MHKHNVHSHICCETLHRTLKSTVFAGIRGMACAQTLLRRGEWAALANCIVSVYTNTLLWP